MSSDPASVAVGASVVVMAVWQGARWLAPLVLPSLFARPAPPTPAQQIAPVTMPPGPHELLTRAEFEKLERRVDDLDGRVAKELSELRSGVQEAALNSAKALGILEGMARK